MADLTQLRAQLVKRATFAVGQAAPRLRQVLQQTSPRESNQMMLNTKVEARQLTASVLVGTGYASFVREGTQPHVIRPKSRKKLAFYWPAAPSEVPKLPDGRVVVGRVNHPGTDPNPWYDNALGRWPEFLRDALRRAPN